MATIILEPGEKFEHTHPDESITIALSDHLTYVCGERIVELNMGERVDTPANQLHTIEYSGTTKGIFGCCHSTNTIAT